ncbi:unnamed protein product [Urochloa humidicola]
MRLRRHLPHLPSSSGAPPPNYSVPEPGATRDESRLCVACRKNPVPVPDQPPYHICVCHFCRSHGVVCSVCDCGPPVSIGERRSSLAAGMDGRKGNEKENDSGTKESSREDTRRTAARAAGAHGGVEDGGTASASAGASGSQLIPGYPGQNVARSAAPFPDYLRGRSSPTGLLLAAEPGGSAPRQGVHGPHVRGQARRSGEHAAASGPGHVDHGGEGARRPHFRRLRGRVRDPTNPRRPAST